jgi:hypothetical protein
MFAAPLHMLKRNSTAITFYTLVMASLMITGGKLAHILADAGDSGRAVSPWLLCAP